MTNQERITIYLSEDTIEWSKRLQEAFKQERGPGLRFSRSAWLNVLIEAGCESLGAQLQLEQG